MNDSSGGCLSIEAVCKVRTLPDGGTAEILKDLSLMLNSATLTVVVGPSGGGKSTLLRLINRLEDPTRGCIFLDREDISTIDPLLLRRRIGTVLQQPHMFEGSVLENLQRPFRYRSEQPPDSSSSRLLDTLQLCSLDSAILSQDSRTLSLGQQQRVCLARTLMTDPEVLLLDEPTSALDRRTLMTDPEVLLLDEPTSALDRPTAVQLGQMLQAICRERSLMVLMTSHDLHLAEQVGDQIAFLHGGCILEQGSVEDFFNNPRCDSLRKFLNTDDKR